DTSSIERLMALLAPCISRHSGTPNNVLLVGRGRVMTWAGTKISLAKFMAGATGVQTPPLGGASPRSHHLSYAPPGGVPRLNTAHRRVKAAPEKPRSHGQISRFTPSAPPLEPVIGGFP